MNFESNTSICDKVFDALNDSVRFPNIQTKIEYMLQHHPTCANTGLYELKLGYLYTEAKDYTSAKKTLSYGLSFTNDYWKQLKFSLIDLAIIQGQLDSALQQAQQLKREFPEWYGAYLILAKIALMKQQFAESIQYAIESNQRQPEADVYVGMAIAYHQLDQDENTANAILEAIRLNPHTVRKAAGMNEAIYSLAKLGRLEDAASLAEGRIMNDPQWNNDPVFVRAANFLASKNYLKANNQN